MAKVKVAINGFGRIGRQVFQIGLNHPEIEFVAINDLTDTKTLAYLLKYDSVHKRRGVDIKAEEDKIIIDGKAIKVYAEKDPENLPWKELGVDVVAECSGFFRTNEKANKHLIAGAKKVVISAPAKLEEGCDIPLFTVVKGVNEHDYDKNKYNIISNASCTTNSIAPVIKVLNDNFGIEKGFITTTHAYTVTQRLVDGPNTKDARRGRAAAVNLIPTSTGAAKAVAQVIPELKGKLDGIAIRVPVPDGSITVFTAVLKTKVTIEDINNLFKNVSKHHLKGVMEYTDEPIVSSDIINKNSSAVFDSALTRVIDGNLVQVFSWYDNEWGYSCRMVDVLKMVL